MVKVQESLCPSRNLRRCKKPCTSFPALAMQSAFARASLTTTPVVCSQASYAIDVVARLLGRLSLRQDTDRNTLRKVNELIRDALRNPFSGIGIPEPFKGNLNGLVVSSNYAGAPTSLPG